MDDMLAALIELHAGLDRQGPGDEAFSRRMLSLLPQLPEHPRIADLGCGSGAGAMLLAEWSGARVTAVDSCGTFLEQLRKEAEARGLGERIRLVEADMGALDWPAASLDLLWSEGAAYNLTFQGALEAWRPLLDTGGVAVVSELSWFTDDVPEPLRAFWEAAYPAVGSEAVNVARAAESGFEVFGIHRLPQAAWTRNYYGPLLERIETLRPDAGEALLQVIRDTEQEITMFRQYSDHYGYAFYLMRAV